MKYKQHSFQTHRARHQDRGVISKVRFNLPHHVVRLSIHQGHVLITEDDHVTDFRSVSGPRSNRTKLRNTTRHSEHRVCLTISTVIWHQHKLVTRCPSLTSQVAVTGQSAERFLGPTYDTSHVGGSRAHVRASSWCRHYQGGSWAAELQSAVRCTVWPYRCRIWASNSLTLLTLSFSFPHWMIRSGDMECRTQGCCYSCAATINSAAATPSQIVYIVAPAAPKNRLYLCISIQFCSRIQLR